MTAIDRVYEEMHPSRRELFLRSVLEEAVRLAPALEVECDAKLRRLGWQYIGGNLVPIELLGSDDLDAVPEAARSDLIKAAARFRDRDLTGAPTAACGAVDSSCAAVYASKGLGDPAQAQSLQEKVSNALEAHGSFKLLETELFKLGWSQDEASQLARNLRQSLNQAAYLMQTFRRRMGDVHGSKPTIEAVVFDSLKWAAIISSMLKSRGSALHNLQNLFRRGFGVPTTQTAALFVPRHFGVHLLRCAGKFLPGQAILLQRLVLGNQLHRALVKWGQPMLRQHRQGRLCHLHLTKIEPYRFSSLDRFDKLDRWFPNCPICSK